MNLEIYETPLYHLVGNVAVAILIAGLLLFVLAVILAELKDKDNE